jgi:DNA-binding MarR family transcriptional regulator
MEFRKACHLEISMLLVPNADIVYAGRCVLERSEADMTSRKTAMIFAQDLDRQSQLEILVRASGCTPVARDKGQTADYALFDLSSETEKHRDSLSEIVEYLSAHRSVALVWTDMDGLEEAFAGLPHDQCHFLVDADDVEAMPILAGAFGRGAMDRLHDRDRDVEFGSLHRISDELAEFARTLARMAEADRKSGVSDKPVSFRPAPIGGFQGFPTTDVIAPPAVDAKALRNIIKMRRLRERFFDSELFADPAWDILLDLKAAAQEGQNVSVSSLCIAAAVPPTTALRWITAMTENGMLERRQDPDDARRVFIVLSDQTNSKLDDYFASAMAQTKQII